MFGCLRTRVRKQPIIALYFDWVDAQADLSLSSRDQRSLILLVLSFKADKYFCTKLALFALLRSLFR